MIDIRNLFGFVFVGMAEAIENARLVIHLTTTMTAQCFRICYFCKTKYTFFCRYACILLHSKVECLHVCVYGVLIK